MKQRISGFTMCPDSIVSASGLVCAAVFGKVARYEEMAEGACTASHARIAADLNISVRAVGEHLRWLTQEGYIKIVKKQSGGTNHYVTTDKVQVVIGATEEPRQEMPNPPQPRQDLPTPSAEFAEPPRQNLPTKILVKTDSKTLKDGGEAAPPQPEYVDVWEDEFNPGSGIKRKPPQSETKPMQIALATVMGYDLKISSNFGKVGRLARELAGAKYTPEQITRIYGPGGVWYQSDWRGKKGELPDLASIAQTVGKLSGITAKNTSIKYNAEEAKRKALEAMGAG